VVGRDGQAEQRPVQVGPWHNDAWVIEKGLSEGDRIIVSGTMGLRPAAPISITRVLTTEEVRARGDGS
jgi:membrane fusion protein (multidrug efflux system)